MEGEVLVVLFHVHGLYENILVTLKCSEPFALRTAEPFALIELDILLGDEITQVDNVVGLIARVGEMLIRLTDRAPQSDELVLALEDDLIA